ncbi:ribosome-recycling factor [Alphaproteobacteria bacterium]
MTEQGKNVTADLNKRMEGAIASLRSALVGLRTGRASTALLEPIKVEAYDGLVPINQVGNVSAPEARLLMVQVWDKSLVKNVEKAILNSGLGLHPVAEGQIVRVPLPDLSEERRKELCKKAAEYCEGAKIAIRNIRRDGMDEFKKMEKNKSISEDALKIYGEEVQKITDSYTKKADSLTAEKIQDVMVV